MVFFLIDFKNPITGVDLPQRLKSRKQDRIFGKHFTVK